MGGIDAVVALRGGAAGSIGRLAVQRLADLAGVRLEEDPARAAVVLDDLDGGLVEVVTGELAGRRLDVRVDEEHLLDLILAAVPARAVRIGVVGAHGGAGATTLAVALAQVPVRSGRPTTYVDLDPVGGVAELVTGVERDPGTRWADLGRQDGSLLPERLVTSLPAFEHVRLLGGDLRGGADARDPMVLRALRAVAQASEVVVADLPREILAGARTGAGAGPGLDRGGGATLGAIAAPGAGDGGAAGGDRARGRHPLLAELDHLVLVTVAGLRGGAAAASAARALGEDGPPVSLVVRRRTGEDVLPEDVAEACGLPVAAVVRHVRSVGADTEHGVLPGGPRRSPLRTVATSLLATLGVAG